MIGDSKAVWADFWGAGGAGPESGCLPRALARIDAVQRRTWSDLARPLAKKARVLDLATGDGAVLGKIRDARPDLELIGVDSSPTLPPSPRGMSLRANVPMEELPFGAATFDLVTSQFGFEYGDTARTAGQVARVLRQGARLAFIIHHRNGPIVAHNDARRGAITWAVAESGLLERARALAAARARLRIPTPATFRTAVAEARALHAGQPVAAEFAAAVLQTLELGQRSRPVETLEVLDVLERKGRNEIARIEALRAAACGSDRIAAFCEQLVSAGLRPQPAELLSEQGSGRPFAWLLTARKP